MSSGFPGDFFTSGRTMMNNASSLPPHNNTLISNPGGGYRAGFNGGMTADRVAGKRSLAEFQQQHQQHQQNIPFNRNPAMLNHLMQQQQRQQIHGEGSLGLGGVNMNVGHVLRSVKQRLYHNHASPISPLSPIDLSGAVLPDVSHAPSGLNNRFGLPIFQQLRQQQQLQHQQGVVNNCNNRFSCSSVVNNGAAAVNGQVWGGFSSSGMNNNRVNSDESEKKIMSNKLQEIEKQLLLDDDDVVPGNNNDDDVSVLTGSEWSETVMNLVTPPPANQSCNNNSSPTTSSSSSSCSSSTSASSKQSVMEAAAAISDGKLEVAAGVIARLSQLCSNNTNTNSNSPEQRMLQHMCSALKLRLCPGEGEEDKKHGEEALLFQLLSQHSVCFKFGYMAANFSIMEATTEATSMRVVDFNIGQGGQYHNLIQLLSMRKSVKPTVVRITAVRLFDGADCEVAAVDKGIGEKLSQLGARLGIRVEFNAVALPDVAGLSRETLGCDESEVLAVNLAYKLHEVPDESVTMDNPRDALLRRVKELSPVVVTMVEQEMNCNTAPLAARVGECWSYYSALLESLESAGGWGRGEEADRIKVEEGLSRKMANSVACEGRDRVERCEVFGKWRARMSMAGFKINPVSQRVVEWLNNSNAAGTRVGQGYFVKEECGGVQFGWMGRTLTVSSAWR